MKILGICLLAISLPLIAPTYCWFLGAQMPWLDFVKGGLGFAFGLFGSVSGAMIWVESNDSCR